MPKKDTMVQRMEIQNSVFARAVEAEWGYVEGKRKRGRGEGGLLVDMGLADDLDARNIMGDGNFAVHLLVYLPRCLPACELAYVPACLLPTYLQRQGEHAVNVVVVALEGRVRRGEFQDPFRYRAASLDRRLTLQYGIR